MDSKLNEGGVRAYWFVGATYGRVDDQTPRFLREGIWENGYHDRYLDGVNSIQPGDRIAIKSSYTRKHDLPFDNRDQTVSVMAIKAVGTVVENFGNGRTLKVSWEPFNQPREWYFYTNRSTLWRVSPGVWTTDALIEFTFKGKDQDINRFRNAPYWKVRFGDRAVDKHLFTWICFYEALADKILTYRNRRDELIVGIHSIAEKFNCMSILNDQYQKGVPGGPLKDICPFTTMGIFNRGITDTNRIAIANELAKLLGVSEPVPPSFEGIPVLNNQRTWFFGYSYNRQVDDIDALWDVFAQAIAFADSEDDDSKSAFISAYNNAAPRYCVGWNLTMGLYWIRPWIFPTLDSRSRLYIKQEININIGKNGSKGRCNANDYLTTMDNLDVYFSDEINNIHSYPELSLAAWRSGTSSNQNPTDQGAGENEVGIADSKTNVSKQLNTYSVDDIFIEGCFIEREKLEKILDRLRTKRNIILQGPPGTGKTWLARRLGFALNGQRDEGKVRAVQFHPNLSYEDFIRGWRPAGNGKLILEDGLFMKVIKAAAQELTSKFVVIIEEINRGNPAQILGEMLTLLEVGKRTQNEALELSYKMFDGERIFIPDNVYVIGTMNVADRSLALVDLALRRRFAFVSLEPTFGKPWHDWVRTHSSIDSEILVKIEEHLNALNDDISADTSLGPQYRLGHSFVTPPLGHKVDDGREWFRQVVETEIGPLLDEYWFDALGKSQKAKKKLLEGF